MCPKTAVLQKPKSTTAVQHLSVIIMDRVKNLAYFFQEVLVAAEHSKFWNEEDVRRSIKWAESCQKIYNSLNRVDFMFDNNDETDAVSELFKSLEIDSYSNADLDDLPALFLKKLLLNVNLSSKTMLCVRSMAEDYLPTEKSRSLWLCIDQVRANRESLRSLLAVSGDVKLSSTLKQSEFSHTFMSMMMSAQYHSWLETVMETDYHNLTKRFPHASNSVVEVSLPEPNLLRKLIFIVSRLPEDDIRYIKLIEWVTTTHKNGSDKIHEMLICQWLSLYWANFDSEHSTDASCFSSVDAPTVGAHCLCLFISKVLVSFFSALYCLCKNNNGGFDCGPEDFVWEQKYSSTSNILSTKNVINFISKLLNCEKVHRDNLSRRSSIHSVDLISGSFRTDHIHLKMRHIVSRALSAYGKAGSPQSNLWTYISEQVNNTSN